MVQEGFDTKELQEAKVLLDEFLEEAGKRHLTIALYCCSLADLSERERRQAVTGPR